jgi:hypothetical protein
MSEKPKPGAKRYRVVAVEDGTYSVEMSEGTGVITKVTGFLNKGTATAWIKDQKRSSEDKPA